MIHLHQNKPWAKIVLCIEMAIIVWLCFLISQHLGYDSKNMSLSA